MGETMGVQGIHDGALALPPSTHSVLDSSASCAQEMSVRPPGLSLTHMNITVVIVQKPYFWLAGRYSSGYGKRSAVSSRATRRTERATTARLRKTALLPPSRLRQRLASAV